MQFVKDACISLGLPMPYVAQCENLEPHEPPNSQQSQGARLWNMDDLDSPKTLQRDILWKRGMARVQVEIVVDNQTLANIANGLARANNEFYRQPLDRIRMRLMT
eukprot:1443504-Karenia_brevis.AAC.1